MLIDICIEFRKKKQFKLKSGHDFLTDKDPGEITYEYCALHMFDEAS